VVNALVAAATVQDMDGQIINVGSGTETSVKDLAREVIEITGGKPEEVYNPRVGAGVSRMCADIQKAKKALNYIPLIPLEMGLRLTLEKDPQYQNGLK
jgi:UDP-glucose 4-epimerase